MRKSTPTASSPFREGFDAWIGNRELDSNPYELPGRLDLMQQAADWRRGFTEAKRCHPELRMAQKGGGQ